MSAWIRIGFVVVLGVAGAAVRAEDPPPRHEVYGAWSFYNNMGWGAYYQGNLSLARDRFTRAVEYLRPYQKEYPGLMARSCHDLTRVLCAQGKHADAEPLAKWVVEAREHDPNTRDDVMFDSLYLLAVVHRELDHHAEAVPLLLRAARLEEQCLGPIAPRLALTLKELADAEAKSDALEEADAHYRRAATIHKRHGIAGPDLAEILAAHAEVLDKLDRTAEADRVRREAAETLEEAEGMPRLADHVKAPLAENETRRGVR